MIAYFGQKWIFPPYNSDFFSHIELLFPCESFFLPFCFSPTLFDSWPVDIQNFERIKVRIARLKSQNDLLLCGGNKRILSFPLSLSFQNNIHVYTRGGASAVAAASKMWCQSAASLHTHTRIHSLIERDIESGCLIHSVCAVEIQKSSLSGNGKCSADSLIMINAVKPNGGLWCILKFELIQTKSVYFCFLIVCEI